MCHIGAYRENFPLFKSGAPGKIKNKYARMTSEQWIVKRCQMFWRKRHRNPPITTKMTFHAKRK
jgi:hypothetical protein